MILLARENIQATVAPPDANLCQIVTLNTAAQSPLSLLGQELKIVKLDCPLGEWRAKHHSAPGR